jgi:hypothetical protein
MPKINLDSPNGHILISLFLVAVGIVLMASGAEVPGEVTGGLYGAGLLRLKQSLSKAGDNE